MQLSTIEALKEANDRFLAAADRGLSSAGFHELLALNRQVRTMIDSDAAAEQNGRVRRERRTLIMPNAATATCPQGREWLLANRTTQCTCPTCLELVGERRRTIRDIMALGLFGLIAMYRRTGEWIMSRDIQYRQEDESRARGGDFAKLRYWGVTERRPGNGAYEYRPTQRGINFAYQQGPPTDQRLPAICWLYCRQPRFSEETADIVDALGTTYNHAEVTQWYVEYEEHGILPGSAAWHANNQREQ